MYCPISLSNWSIIKIGSWIIKIITSCAYITTFGLKIFFHFYAHSEIFLRSAFISPADNGGSQTVENKEVSSANNLASDSKLLGRSFIYTKKRSNPNIEPCGKPALINDYDDTGH